MTDFEKGVLYSAGIVFASHSAGTIARELIEQAGLTGIDCSELDEYDKQNLRDLSKVEGMNLKGL